MSQVKRLWVYRITIAWALLFTANALVTATLAAIVNVDWSKLNIQARIIIFMSVFVNWAGTMMAFFTQAVKKLEQGELIINGSESIKNPSDTTVLTKADVKTVTIETKQ